MWKSIRENKTNSVILLSMLAVVLIMLGGAIGFYFSGQQSLDGLFFGSVIAVVIWLIMLMTSLYGGEEILLRTAGARKVSHSEAPQLYNVVEEMQLASGLTVTPAVYIIDTPVPNAFAVGRTPERAAIAVTAGLMSKLNRDELQGVVAHELGHIVNRDTLFMTLAGVTVGAVVIISDLFLRSLWYSSRARRGVSRGGDKLAPIIMVVSIVFAVLAPFMAQLLYFACSRKREYLADASAVKFTRYPEGLAAALEKILGAQTDDFNVSRTHAPMYIINPLAARGKSSSLFSTHPPVEERIQVLRNMVAGSSFADYDNAYKNLKNGENVIDYQTLLDTEPQEIRSATARDSDSTEKQKWRETQNIFQSPETYGMLMCTCGLNMKIPRNFDEPAIECPKCGHQNRVPAEFLAAAEILDHHPSLPK